MLHVMIVDDDPMLRQMLEDIFGEAGWQTSTAEDGRRALERLETAQPPDLVVTDIIMPDKEGLELIQDIRRFDRHLPVVAISGGGRIDPQSYLNLARQFGAVETVAKPFTPSSILEAAGRALQVAGP